MKKHNNIIYSVNDHYFVYFIASIQSLFENIKKDTSCHVTILYSDLKKEYIKILNDFSKLMSTRDLVIKVLDTKKLIETYSHLLYKTSFYSLEMYYRILIPTIFKDQEKVLYIDCDTIINNDISELFKIDMGDNLIAACKNISSINMCNYIQSLNLNPDFYLNSGLILFHCKKCYSSHFTERCFNFLKEKQIFKFPDQDIINKCLNGKFYQLPLKWNFQWHHYILDDRNIENDSQAVQKYYDDLIDTIDNISIIHYTSSTKPTYFYDDLLAPEYFYYLYRSPLYLIWKRVNKREDLWGDDPIRLSDYEINIAIEKLRLYYPNIKYEGRLPWGHSGSDILLLNNYNKKMVARITSEKRANHEKYVLEKFGSKANHLINGILYNFITVPKIKRDYKVAISFNNYINGTKCSVEDMYNILKQGFNGEIYKQLFVADYEIDKQSELEYNNKLIKRFANNIKNAFGNKEITSQILGKYSKKFNHNLVFGHCDASRSNIIVSNNKYYAIDYPSGGIIADKLQFARSLNSFVLENENKYNYSNFEFSKDINNNCYLIYDLIVRYIADIYNVERSKKILNLLIKIDDNFKEVL